MGAKVWKLLVFMFIMTFALSAAHSAYALGVTRTITLGGAPWGAAYDSGKGEVFVVNSRSNSVWVISDSTYAVKTTVTVGQGPYRVDYDPGKGEIFVANFGAGTVSVISDSNNSVVATVTVGSGPYDLAYDSAKGEVFVANSGARTVSVISDSDNSVVATVPAGSGPLGVAYDSAMGEIFVVNSVSDTVSVISDGSNSVVATVTVGTSPAPIVYDSGKGELFVLNRNSATASVISDSTNAVIANVTVGNSPYGVAYDPGKGEIFVANRADGTLSVISDSSGTSTTSTTTSSTTSSTPSSTPTLVEQVWVPNPTNAVAAVAVSAVAIGAVSLVFAAMSNPLAEVGGTVAEKTKGIIPDNIKEWLEEVFSSKRKLDAAEKKGSPFRPTRTEILAYIVSIIVLAVSFSYVKVNTLSQIWALLPVFFATSFLVGFVQQFFSIVYLRSKGVWSEQMIWPLGLVMFLFTTFAFKVPFSSPTRSANSTRFTERLGAIVSASGILISLAFAGLFFLLLKGGYSAVGDAGLSMCVIGSFFGTFPVSPMSGKDIFNHSKPLWAGLFIITMVIFAAWLLLI